MARLDDRPTVLAPHCPARRRDVSDRASPSGLYSPLRLAPAHARLPPGTPVPVIRSIERVTPAHLLVGFDSKRSISIPPKVEWADCMRFSRPPRRRGAELARRA